MSGWRRVVRDAMVAVLAVVAYFLVPAGPELDRGPLEQGTLSLVLIGLAGALVIWQVLRQIEDPGRRVEGLVLSMLVGVLVFALAFYRLQVEDPSQFNGLETRLDSLYYTMTTLLTVGFGDVNAAGQMARFMVLLQMVFNIAVLATAATTLNNRVRENALRRAETRREGRSS